MANNDPLRFYMPYPPPRPSKDNSKNADLENLRKRAENYIRCETLRIRRLINAPEGFAVDGKVKALKANIYRRSVMHFDEFSNSLNDCYLPEETRYELKASFAHLENLRVREAHEIVLWGQSLEVTQKEIDFFEQEIEKKTSEARTKRLAQNETARLSIVKPATELEDRENDLNDNELMTSTGNASASSPSNVGSEPCRSRQDSGESDRSSLSNGLQGFSSTERPVYDVNGDLRSNETYERVSYRFEVRYDPARESRRMFFNEESGRQQTWRNALCEAEGEPLGQSPRVFGSARSKVLEG